MTRGTLANIRLKNRLLPNVEGSFTILHPGGERMTIYEASERYRKDGVPLIILAGKEYGSGSSRDWAAKGVLLLGVRAVLAESYERIHRSNLVGMGVLPLQYMPGETADTLGLTGQEFYTLTGLEHLSPGGQVTVTVELGTGSAFDFQARVRINTAYELEVFRNGGILPLVLRRLLN
jgi:aconitate hydratase